MRRRRRTTAPADSLELLLDTLCNTFGGVLFIAILVVILLQMTGGRSASPGTHSTTADELHDLTAELDIVTRELDALRKRMPQSHRDDSPPIMEETVDFRQQAASARERLEELTRLGHEKLSEANRHDAQKLAIDEDLASLDQRAARVNREIEDLRLEIAKEQKAHARSLRTPVMHQTNKQSLTIELRYARLYLLHRYDPSGERLGPNLDDYVLLSDRNAGLLVTADPTQGMPMGSPAELKVALKKKLAHFSPERWIIDLAIRADSFDGFHSLMMATQELGYEMRLTLVEDDGVFSDRGGTRKTVQ